MHIRTAAIEDLAMIRDLYQHVAKIEGGLARTEQEISEEYVKNFVTKSLDCGLILVAEHPDQSESLVGEIHAYSPGPAVFRHILSDLTIGVHPGFQGKKIGRTLFTIFLEEIALHHPEIGRVELIVRESNLRAIKFYQSFGFQIEGRMEMRIKTPQGNYEADIPMSWQNPNFEF